MTVTDIQPSYPGGNRQRGADQGAQVADKLSVTRDLINDAMRLRRLPSLKPGGSRLITVDALEELLTKAR
jgi:excisionase family DNA binding protein